MVVKRRTRNVEGTSWPAKYYGTWFSHAPKSRADLFSDNKAVSPVIAVILMVAITVVLAATVFVLVADIGDNQAMPGPQMSFSEDKARGNLTVNQAPNNLRWDDFEITGCTTIPTGTVEAGDRMMGCDGDVTIRHKPSNSLVYSGRF